MNEFEIKMRLFKKINIDEIIELTGLNYGILHADYVMEHKKTGKYTILYDGERIGSGVEISFDKNKVLITNLNPVTKSDIKLTYYVIDFLCAYFNRTDFIKNGNKYSIADIEDLMKEDTKTSEKILAEMSNKFYLNIEKNIFIIGALNPISLGLQEMEEINESLDNYEDLLHKYQTRGICFPDAKIYKRKNGENVLMYFAFEDERTLFYKKPDLGYIPEKITDIYVCIPDLNSIPYDDFINNVKTERYDEKGVIVSLTSKEINKLKNKYAVDPITGEKVKKEDTHYFEKIIDRGFYHFVKIERNDFDLDILQGYNHIAIFFRYSYEKGWISEELLNVVPDIKDYIENNKDIRNIFHTNIYFDRSLKLGFFKKEVQSFIDKFYNYDNKNNYPSEIDKYALKVFGKEKYNCPEFNDEAYLFLDYDENYYKELSKVIEREYKKFNKENK